jgi:hypothetical protein
MRKLMAGALKSAVVTLGGGCTVHTTIRGAVAVSSVLPAYGARREAQVITRVS